VEEDLKEAIHRHGFGPVRTMVVGARGTWTSAEKRGCRSAWSGLARKVIVLSDVELLFESQGWTRGIVLVAGTGSIAYGRDGTGTWARSGGWGPVFGDEGSAFWIGREYIRQRLASPSDYQRGRRLSSQYDTVRKIAALAPVVIRRASRGDRSCARIVREAQEHLADLVAGVEEDLKREGRIHVAMAGGLMGNVAFREGVRRRLNLRAKNKFVFETSKTDAALAAARMAFSLKN